MDGTNKFTLLREAVLIIPHGVLKLLEFEKDFLAEMTTEVHQFTKEIWGRFRDEFLLAEAYKGSVLPVVQVGVRAKVRAKLAPTAFICRPLVFRSSS